MSNTIINSCDPITSIEDAKAPFVSPLIPISGLRHDEKGDLTTDALQIILDGMKSLGVDPADEVVRTAILKEAKQTLCKINSQYEFLVKSFIGNEAITDKDTLALLSEKNQTMKDILSVSRHIMEMSSSKDKPSMVEGFLGTLTNTNTNTNNKLREGFDSIEDITNKRDVDLQNGSVPPSEFRKQTLEVSEQENRSVNTYLSVYGFMNVVAAGLLFYIISVK